MNLKAIEPTKLFVYSLLLLFVVGCSNSNKNNEVNLIIACVNGAMDKVELYSSKLPTVNYVSIKGDTPLNAAAANGNIEVVKYLVAQGAIPDLKDSYGLSAIESAQKNGHLEVVEFLMAFEKD